MDTQALSQILDFTLDHLEGISGSLSFLLSAFVFKQMLADKRQSSDDKRIEIYMNLSQQWADLWARITAFPQSNKKLFCQDISEIQDENQRLQIANAIHLLSRVHYYYRETKQDITKSEWDKTVRYVMRKKLFRSMYQKHEHRYSDDFVAYIKNIRIEDKLNNVIEVQIKTQTSKQNSGKK